MSGSSDPVWDEQAHAALQLLVADPRFQSRVAEAWVKAAERHEGKPRRGELSVWLRHAAVEDARGILALALAARVAPLVEARVASSVADIGPAVDASVRRLLAEKTPPWNGLTRLDNLVRGAIDARLQAIVAEEVEARLAPAFDYLRRGMALAIRGATERLLKPPT